MDVSNPNQPLQNNQSKSPYKLNQEQEKVYVWLKSQGLNVDDNTLNYWSRKYRAQRLIDVVKFAHRRCAEGQQIRNMGGWIHKLLKDETIVVTDECRENREYVEKYALKNGWKGLHIYEKYIKDESTKDDLPLTLSTEDFRRALETLYSRVQLYSDCC